MSKSIRFLIFSLVLFVCFQAYSQKLIHTIELDKKSTASDLINWVDDRGNTIILYNLTSATWFEIISKEGIPVAKYSQPRIERIILGHSFYDSCFYLYYKVTVGSQTNKISVLAMNRETQSTIRKYTKFPFDPNLSKSFYYSDTLGFILFHYPKPKEVQRIIFKSPEVYQVDGFSVSDPKMISKLPKGSIDFKRDDYVESMDKMITKDPLFSSSRGLIYIKDKRKAKFPNAHYTTNLLLFDENIKQLTMVSHTDTMNWQEIKMSYVIDDKLFLLYSFKETLTIKILRVSANDLILLKEYRYGPKDILDIMNGHFKNTNPSKPTERFSPKLTETVCKSIHGKNRVPVYFVESSGSSYCLTIGSVYIDPMSPSFYWPNYPHNLGLPPAGMGGFHGPSYNSGEDFFNTEPIDAINRTDFLYFNGFLDKSTLQISNSNTIKRKIENLESLVRTRSKESSPFEFYYTFAGFNYYRAILNFQKERKLLIYEPLDLD